ncbi:hypothetical protein GMOD_00002940 [Pyrenophora seminiperda CCB06]|uniref:Uncharacterized protein n=1 Tax=Pyrenophora seminiperda CCB06 TaxID=1302712 RepID=A0A3M7M3R8_9PLEO|nr:hypothetical protein GMOD_00002940 [Pyrenophora seminiperda CCB06]
MSKNHQPNEGGM